MLFRSGWPQDVGKDPYFADVKWQSSSELLFQNNIFTEASGGWEEQWQPIVYNNNNTDGTNYNVTFKHQANKYFSKRFIGTNDGSGNSYITVNNASKLQLGTSNFTIEFWMMFTSYDGTRRHIASKGSTTGPTGWTVFLDTNYTLQYCDVSTCIGTSVALSRGVWYHCAFVREGTGSNQMKLYINGQLMATGTSSSNYTQTDAMYIGGDRGLTGGTRWGGQVAAWCHPPRSAAIHRSGLQRSPREC